MDLGLMAIVASGLIAVVLGFVWYHPKVFGTGSIDPNRPLEAPPAARNVFVVTIFGFLAAMIVAYVMSYVSIAWGFYDYAGALKLGIWCWLGFVAPIFLSTVLWEKRTLKSFAINASYWLVVMLIMAQVLVWAAAASYTPYSDTSADSGMYVGE